MEALGSVILAAAVLSALVLRYQYDTAALAEAAVREDESTLERAA